jgi:hypothetical protein
MALARVGLSFWLSLACLAGCIDLPEKVVLKPEAEKVELLTETPNENLYEPFGSVRGEAIGHTSQGTAIEARNDLRNHAAAIGARFVTIDSVDASLAWDLSGRTVVVMRGKVYRLKD